LARLNDSLRRAKIKHNFQRVETIVSSGVGVVENILKLKWSKATKLAFSIVKTELDMLDAEATIADNDLYYIVKANETFGRDR
jgi:predicted NACHT family NTPase